MNETKKRATILIVDDERYHLNVLVELLKTDYKTMIAKNGETAIKLCQCNAPRNQVPDMILLDILLPEIDGYSVCRILKNDPNTKHIVIIFITALESMENEAKGLELGAVDYITKPISPPIVLARIKTHLALEFARRELEQKNQALVQWQKQIRILMQHAPAAIAMFDRHSCYLQVSQRWLEEYHLTDAKKIIGKNHFDIFPDLPKRWKEIFARGLQGIFDKQFAEPFQRSAHEPTQWLNWEVSPWWDSSGEVGGILLFTEDVTPKKILEEKQRKEQEKFIFEKSFIETIITKMRKSAPCNLKYIRSLDFPVEKTGGDMLLAGFRADGTQHIVIGDFTGHGLPAAICCPMLSDLFYAQTAANASMEHIFMEFNRQLKEKVPIGMFFAAVFLAINPRRDTLTVWNCHAPDVLHFRDGVIQTRVESSFMARGILVRPEKPGVNIKLRSKDRIFVSTDGIIETQSPTGSEFGQTALDNLLIRIVAQGEPLDVVIKTLTEFREGHPQLDDITLAEITC
ncbi:MAG: SpoIIE family protein phosphatase [Magnetococcus sp. DMHC-6]